MERVLNRIRMINEESNYFMNESVTGREYFRPCFLPPDIVEVAV